MTRTEEQPYLKDKRFIVTAHTMIAPEDESAYLVSRVKRLLVIRHPLVEAGTAGMRLASTAFLYESGELKKSMTFPAPRGPEPLFWIRDAIATFIFVWRSGGKYDVFIGTDIANAFLGLMLRGLRRTRRVVYAATDYIPERYKNRILNRFYHYIERVCCYSADCIWDVSPAIAPRRYESGVEKDKCAPVIIVQNGCYFEEIPRRPVSGIDRYRLIYLGALDESKGVELIVDAMPEIIKKVPAANLVIVGGGASEASLRQRAAESNVKDKIMFQGIAPNHIEGERYLVEAAVGVAPYVPTEEGYINFGDPAKIKQYLACGLPVIMTNVSHIAAEITQRQAGIVIGYDRQELVDSAVKLLTDTALYVGYRANAITMGEDYSWTEIFNRAFTESRSLLFP